MYAFDDTIVAVSSAGFAGRVILRLSGSRAQGVVSGVFAPALKVSEKRIVAGRVSIGEGVSVEAFAYVFAGGASYTGEDIVELHFVGNRAVSEYLLGQFLQDEVRLAEAGEFTARAFLNGKMDLSQAEAVNEILTSGNRCQIGAAEELLKGRLGCVVGEIRGELVEILSGIEAGLDFSEHDIEFAQREVIGVRLGELKVRIEGVLSGAVSFEVMGTLASVGVGGKVNAGKSSIVNAMLGQERSIVSDIEKTTRDILTSRLELGNNSCVLFDSAGLVSEAETIVDELCQRAAVEALSKSELVLFCVDSSRAAGDLSEDVAMLGLIESKRMIGVASKCDLVEQEKIGEVTERLQEVFGFEFVATSSKSGFGIEALKERIDAELSAVGSDIGVGQLKSGAVYLTARHKNSLAGAVEEIDQGIDELGRGNDEVAAMYVRAGLKGLSEIGSHDIDEEILSNIFSNFCVGK